MPEAKTSNHYNKHHNLQWRIRSRLESVRIPDFLGGVTSWKGFANPITYHHIFEDRPFYIIPLELTADWQCNSSHLRGLHRQISTSAWLWRCQPWTRLVVGGQQQHCQYFKLFPRCLCDGLWHLVAAARWSDNLLWIWVVDRTVRGA